MGPGDNFDPLSVHYGASDYLWSEFGCSKGNSIFKSLPNGYVNNYIKNEHSSPPVPSQTPTKFPPYNDPSSQLNLKVNSSSCGPGSSLSENVAVMRPSGGSVSSQHVGFPTGLPPLIPDVTTQQNFPSLRANKFSSGLFPTPGSGSSSLETDYSRAPVKANQNSINHEHDVGYYEQRLEKVSFLQESSPKIHNSTLLSSNAESQPSLRKHYSGVDGVASRSFMRHAFSQPSDQVEQKGIGTPVVSLGDSRVFGHSLHQNHSLLHQLHRRRDGQTDCVTRFTVHNQLETADSNKQLLSGDNIAVKDEEKSSLEGVNLSSFSPDKDKGNFILEAQEDLSGKASSTDYLHTSQQMEMFGKNDTMNQSIDSKETSGVAYLSQISLQMAPSWFKYYDLKNDQALPTCDPKAAITPMQPFSGLSI